MVKSRQTAATSQQQPKAGTLHAKERAARMRIFNTHKNTVHCHISIVFTSEPEVFIVGFGINDPRFQVELAIRTSGKRGDGKPP